MAAVFHPIETAPCPWLRRHLSFDAMIETIRRRAEELPDARRKPTYPLADAIMSGFAMFSLKDPSMLAFEERRDDSNMKTIFHIGQIPCDTQSREILDPVEPDSLRPMFNDIFRYLQRGKVLERFRFQGHYLVSVDGTGHFSSNSISCPSCMCKTSKNGQKTYYHQLLAAAVVSPGEDAVIPLAPEPIVKQDGATKNDCERNAAKRLLWKFRQEHPLLKVIVIEDGLASNAPHIRLLQELNMRFLLIVKEDDHQYLFNEVLRAYDQDRAITLSYPHEDNPKVSCEITIVHDLPLNASNSDIRVTFVEYSEYAEDGTRLRHFAWITDLEVTRENAPEIVAAGRSRWKIENETFNVLKNHGYQLEHNYGHGKQNLSTVLAMLMMLAFLVDQTQQLCCPLFQAVFEKVGSKRLLWERQRSFFYHFQFPSMRELHEAMFRHDGKKLPSSWLMGPTFPELRPEVRLNNKGDTRRRA